MFERVIINIQRSCHQKSTLSKKGFIDVLYLSIMGRFYQYYLVFFYNSYIPIGAKIGGNIKLNHSFHNIFISEHCEIGDNVTILQNTTIGSNQPINDRAPHIGDNVFIGANCNIIGDVVIGSDSIIGAGTTIANGRYKRGSIIVGAKCRVIEK